MRPELQPCLIEFSVSPEELYDSIALDKSVLQGKTQIDLLTNPELRLETLARIRQKLVELTSLRKIDQAKASVSEKIKQRMEALQRMLERS